MSNNQIALTASMRSNLLSLKNTQKLMNTTQDHLSTGYKVNSAMDNPSSYFTAQSLNSRASDLSTLLDSIGQAISTLEVADQGITSLQSLVEQAKSTANSARDTANVPANVSSSIKFDTDALKSQKVAGEAVVNAEAGDKMVIRYGDATKMTGTTNVTEDTTLNGIKLEDADAGSIKVDGKEYKLATNAAENSMVTTLGDGDYEVTGVDRTDADHFKFTVKAGDGKEYTIDNGSTDVAVEDGGKVGGKIKVTGFEVTVSADGKTTAAGTAAAGDGTAVTDAPVTTINVKTGSTVQEFANTVNSMIGTTKFEASVTDSNMTFKTLDTTSVEVTGKVAEAFGMDKGVEIELAEDDTAESLRQKINNLEGITAEFDKEGHMVVKSAEGDDMVISGALADKLGISGAATNGSNERAAYAKQFSAVMTQIDELVQDTSYKGINLLKGDDLTVVFNENRTSTLELKGVTFDSTGLGFTEPEGEWKTNASIDKALDQITKATSMLRAQASEFGQNLSTVQIREDFTENMINNLQSGADKLTLADSNEEAANMLALQTRQQLGVNSLSLASQSAQSVLRLF